jgi:integrase
VHSVHSDDLAVATYGQGIPIDGHPAPIPWVQFRAELLSLWAPPMCAKSTACKMRQVLGELDHLAVDTTADLTPLLVSRYIAMRPPNQSAYTLHAVLRVVRVICSYAQKAGYLRVSPFTLRPLCRWVRLTPLEGKRHFSREETRRLLDLMAKDVRERQGWAQWRARRLQAVASTVAYTGMRKMEALHLQVKDVDLAPRVIWIRPNGKTGRLKTAASEAPVPIPLALVPILTEWLAHRMDAPFGFVIPEECPWLIPTCNRRSPWTSGQPGGKALDRLKAVAKRAGVEDMTFLALRHGWATHAEFWGYGANLTQRVLRHTNTRTQLGYRHADLPNIVERTAGFDF